MITGDIRSKVDAIWNAFWTGGISNPLEVMEQITYLLFIKRLDDEQAKALNMANTLRKPITGNPFPTERENLRWKNLLGKHPDEVFDIVSNEIFPFIRQMRGDNSTYADFMKDARLTV